MINIFKKKNKEGVKPIITIIMGKSGSGKGTQIELYIKKLNEINGLKTLHIETGKLLRELVKKSSYTANLTKDIIFSGGLMPESVVIGLWINYLMNNYSGKENLVFDGCPRKLQETLLLDGTFKFYNIEKYNVVYINTSDKWCMDRLLARGRKDDTVEGINKRMEWFRDEVMPSINFFKESKNCNFVEVNGEQTVEQVHIELINKIGIK